MYVWFGCIFRCKLWLINCRRADLDKFFNANPQYLYENCRLCAEHFEPSQFLDPAVKNRLIANAVPTSFNVPNPPKRLSTARNPPAKRSCPQVAESTAASEFHTEVAGNLHSLL
jgi:hypothetical protein